MAGPVAAPADRTHVRLAELVAALSLGIDLGFSQPMEHVLRQCLISLRMAEALGLDDGERAVLYYTALLINVGCHSDAHEQAKWFGDDITCKAFKYDYEPRSIQAAASGLKQLGSGLGPLHRFRLLLDFAISGHHEVDGMIVNHAAIARTLGEQLELPAQAVNAIGTSYEFWDGKGWPGELEGEAIPRAARIASLAEYLEVANRVGGLDAARELARRRRGGQFDPQLCDLIDADGDVVLSGLDAVGTWDAVIAAEPSLAPVLSGDRLDSALIAVADFIDIKSPYFLGHARAVAALAREASRNMGASADEQLTAYRTALVHDFGRLGVSNAVLDKPGPLGAGERERVRLQPQITDRMLRQSAALAPFAAIAVQHRERLDGSGYPAGLSGAGISPQARLLGAADAYQAMREPRPHREALAPEAAAAALRAEVKAGRLDGDCVDAVLAAAGHRIPRRREGPSGLTAREVEVLVLVARGLSNKEVATRLVISPKTVGNHVEHIYTKIGTSNRAAASLFAVRNGLLPEEGFPGHQAPPLS